MNRNRLSQLLLLLLLLIEAELGKVKAIAARKNNKPQIEIIELSKCRLSAKITRPRTQSHLHNLAALIFDSLYLYAVCQRKMVF